MTFEKMTDPLLGYRWWWDASPHFLGYRVGGDPGVSRQTMQSKAEQTKAKHSLSTGASREAPVDNDCFALLFQTLSVSD